MALIMMEGFDIGLAGVPDQPTRFPGAAVAASGGRFGGGYLSSSGSQSFNFPAAMGSGICGYAYQRLSADSAGGEFVALYAGVTKIASVRTKAADFNKVEILVNDVVVSTIDKPTALLTQWTFLEIGWTVGAGTGKFQLYWNGVKVADLTAQNMGAANVTELRWPSPPSSQVIDDLYLLDLTGSAPYNAPLGDVRVETLLPNADGASSQWVGSDGNSLQNYLLVDENPPNSTDYVGTNVLGNRDLYGLTDPSGAGAGDILAVQAQAFFAKNDAGAAPGTLKAVLRASTGEVSSTQVATPAQISTSYVAKEGGIATTDPAGAAWTGAALTALQAGVEVTA